MISEKLRLVDSNNPVEYRNFEGISLQKGKGKWEFIHPEKGDVEIDTYSIWDSDYYDVIAQRLAEGERCAMFIMGTYGVGQIREAPEWQKGEVDDTIFDSVKQRPKVQNLVTFINPEDAIDIIDIDKLNGNNKQFRWAEKRAASYAGPQHNIFPLRQNGLVDEGFVRHEGFGDTVACFWIPDHPGYEGLYNAVRKKVKHGIFGGGSLNIHGQEPSYTSSHLQDQMQRIPQWQEGIDFVIFDEIAESHKIGRSQTMVSFVGNSPELVRLGSLSAEYISEKTGNKINYASEDIENGKIKKASSLTPYAPENNKMTEQRIEEAMAQMKRFKFSSNRQVHRLFP